MTTTAPAIAFTVHAIPPDELEQIRRRGRDVAGNEPTPYEAIGAPLRCCLRRATSVDEVVLISHAPLRERSAWREVGPVFVHAGPCPGSELLAVPGLREVHVRSAIEQCFTYRVRPASAVGDR